MRAGGMRCVAMRRVDLRRWLPTRGGRRRRSWPGLGCTPTSSCRHCPGGCRHRFPRLRRGSTVSEYPAVYSDPYAGVVHHSAGVRARVPYWHSSWQYAYARAAPAATRAAGVRQSRAAFPRRIMVLSLCQCVLRRGRSIIDYVPCRALRRVIAAFLHVTRQPTVFSLVVLVPNDADVTERGR